MEMNQYVVSAVLKDGEKNNEYIRLVTNDYEQAIGYDVSSYKDTSWNVYLEHFVINEKRYVVEYMGAKILYPQDSILA